MHSALMKSSLQEFTKAEFAAFVADISNVTDPEQNDAWVLHFIQLVPHPAGSDLIYWPAEGADNSPEGIVADIEAYCQHNDVQSFKDSSA